MVKESEVTDQFDIDNLESKEFKLEFKQDENDAEYYKIEGYASTFGNIDRANDIIAKGAFQQTIQRRMPKLLNQHKMDEPIGTIDSAVEDEQGLYIKGRMPKNNRMVQDLVPLIKMGALGDFSIGFNVADSEINNDGVRVIKEADLWEVSVVTIPANAKARIMSIKSVTPYKNLPIAPRERNWDSNASVRRIREYTDSQDAPSSDYKNYFLWYDAENTSNFGAYKLPYADIIDGQPKAIVNALVAAKAALAGARGGVDIPDADKSTVENHINRYLERVGVGDSAKEVEFADDFMISVLDLEEVRTKRDLEKLFLATGKISRKAANFLVARYKDFSEDDMREAKSDSGNSDEKKIIADLISCLNTK